MAGVAKWLRQRVVVPPFAGSSPVIRPQQNILRKHSEKLIKKNIRLCHAIVVLN